MGNGGTIWWETLAHEDNINMGNLVSKGTMQWASLAQERYTDMGNLVCKATLT